MPRLTRRISMLYRESQPTVRWRILAAILAGPERVLWAFMRLMLMGVAPSGTGVTRTHSASRFTSPRSSACGSIFTYTQTFTRSIAYPSHAVVREADSQGRGLALTEFGEFGGYLAHVQFAG